MVRGVGSYEILEHTADVGLRATGESLEEVFVLATRALAEIAGIWVPGDGDEVALEVEAADPGALLVDWLSEVLYLHDSRGMALANLVMSEATESRARGTLRLAPLKNADGTQVKAITYHQLVVEPTTSGWLAQVFVDI